MTHFGAARQHLFHDALIFYLLVFGAPYVIIIISRGNINHIRMEAKRNGEITRRKRWRNFMRNDSRNRDSPCRCLQRGCKRKKRPKWEGKKIPAPRRCGCTWIFFAVSTTFILYIILRQTVILSNFVTVIHLNRSHRQMKPKIDVYSNYIIL